MSQAMEYVEYLSREIGARPAGTEEEQQAALYITERLQNDTEFPATIEDFTGSSNLGGLRMLCSLVAVVITILAMALPMLAIPAFVLDAAAAAIYVLETYGNHPVSRMLARGASQNVVAKYQPEASANARRRKIVLVAHYDTGKVTPALMAKLESIGLPLGPLCAGALCLNALLMLVRVVAFSGSGGIGLVVFNVITILVLIVAIVPGVRGILYQIAPYNEGANNNATGVAAIMEVARRISFGSVSEADLAAMNRGVSIHGADEAYRADLIPEGAQLVYEASQLQPPNVELMTDEDRLAAAKAAIAAFTGQPVPRRTSTDIATKLVGARASEPMSVIGDTRLSIETAETAGQEPARAEREASAAVPPVVAPAGVPQASYVAPEPEPVVEVVEEEEQPEEELSTQFDNVPSWFAAAQRKAKRTSSDAGTVQRSRYAEAINAAERELEARREEQARAAEAAVAEATSQAVQAALAESAARDWKPEEKPEPEPEPEVVEEEPQVEVEYDQQLLEVTAPLTIEETVEEAEEQVGAAPDTTAPFEYVPADADSTGDVRRRPIVLPSYDEERGQEARVVGATKQRAPLAEAAEDSQQAARTMLTMLPSVDDEPAPVPSSNLSHSGMMRRLRADLPSLSGAIRAQNGEGGEEHFSNVSTVGSFGAAGATGAFAPVGEELLEDVDPDDIYVDDADDSDIEDNFTETGAIAGPGYVEMPKSRIGRFFDNLFGHKEETLAETPQEWLDVDEEFDPRTVGRERGGWESFRQDDDEPARKASRADEYDDYDEFDEYDEYEAVEDAMEAVAEAVSDVADEAQEESARHHRWQGGGFSRMRLGHVDMRSSEGSDAPIVAEAYDEEAEPAEELESIYHFRNPDYTTEVWFVALGSEVGSHDGIEAFMDAHRNELRGAMIIDVEALGAGDLSVVQEEGVFKRVKTSSRIKRYVQKANAATGMSLGVASLRNAESSSSVALKGGMQAVRLVGIEDGAPALRGASEDVIENIDEDLLERNIDYLMELIRFF